MASEPPRAPTSVDTDTYREVLRFDKPEFNHNGGTIAFGPDGLLYAAFGDGGNANDVGAGHITATGNAQNLGTILGKVIRINPLEPPAHPASDGDVSANGQYRIPRDNPFVRRAGALGEIFAYGFRNPYRFSFDSEAGRPDRRRRRPEQRRGGRHRHAGRQLRLAHQGGHVPLQPDHRHVSPPTPSATVPSSTPSSSTTTSRPRPAR